MPYWDVLLKDSVLLVFLFYYLFLHCTAFYFCSVCFCFNLNLVVVVNDYYSLTLHLIFLGNPFLKLEETYPIRLYRFYLNFVFITNMYSFSSYLTHYFFVSLSDVGWICKVDATHPVPQHHFNPAQALCISISLLSIICMV